MRAQTMKTVLLALGAGIVCSAQSSIQVQTDGPLAGGPFTTNAGSGQPFTVKFVIGRPFTADAIIKTDQILPDGSHIVNQQTVAAARDSQGRTYREETFASTAVDGFAPKTIFISDAMAGVSYILGPDHVARKVAMPMPGSQADAISVSTSAPLQANLLLQSFQTAVGGGNGPVRAGPQGAQPAQQISLGEPKVDQLGSQMIAGV